MRRISKAIAGGMGAAIARIAILFLPEMDAETREAVEYVIYVLLTGLSVYIAPANATYTHKQN
jgi:hypothetical protein